MAIIQTGQVINAGNLISAWYQDAVSVSSQGNGVGVSRGNSVNFADGIAWGPASGSLSAQYPTSDAAWIPLFGGLGRAGNPTGNAWATANVDPTDFKKTAQDNLILAQNYSGIPNDLDIPPSNVAVLYQSAQNFLSVNWCLAVRNVTGGGATPYGPLKGSFSIAQGNITDPTGPAGYIYGPGTGENDIPGSLANATYGNSETTSNPVDQAQWGINNYFYALKSQFNSRPTTNVSITVCHVSCHSSCHGSRGRR